jgi:ubiquinone/menaquinone biosynthesis C-methylase UbiE
MSIEKEYDSWAGQYDSNENKTRDLDKKLTIETLSKYQFENVIELGCGTGKNTKWLVDRAEQIVGLDFSTGMLEKASRKIKSPKVRFQRADLNLDWRLEDAFADLITCSLTLEHIENLDFIFAQVYQKLKPKGKFFVCELHPFKQYSGSKAKYETENGTKELEVFVHHVSDYVAAATKNKFKLIELNEGFDEPDRETIPRLIAFVFEK